MKPIIGITTDVNVEDANERNGGGKLVLNWNYAQAIADAGGVPVLIPPQADPAEIASILDGLVIPGGPDIDACEFGEENHPEVKTVPRERFQGEKNLFVKLDSSLPVLGICYGCQFINVMQGGSLIQHLPDIVGHEGDQNGTLQAYSVEKGSRLGEAVGMAEPKGESWHHQAVKELGQDLKVTARNPDGTIEALESTSRPWLIGVQWHPERTLDKEDSQQLFRAFVNAAREYRSRRAN